MRDDGGARREAKNVEEIAPRDGGDLQATVRRWRALLEARPAGPRRYRSFPCLVPEMRANGRTDSGGAGRRRVTVLWLLLPTRRRALPLPPARPPRALCASSDFASVVSRGCAQYFMYRYGDVLGWASVVVVALRCKRLTAKV